MADSTPGRDDRRRQPEGYGTPGPQAEPPSSSSSPGSPDPDIGHSISTSSIHTLPRSASGSVGVYTNSDDSEAPLSFSSAEDSPASPLPPAQPTSTTSNRPNTLYNPPSRPSLNRAGTDPYMPPGRAAPHREDLSSIPGPSTSTSSSARTTRARPNSHRYADPDQHWLSEDEGGMLASDVRSSRRSHREAQLQRRGSGPGSDDSKDGDTDKGARSALQIPGTATSHPIHHRPAAAALTDPTLLAACSKDFMRSLLPDLSSVTPNLIKALQCTSCDSLMRDPTTLLCGHSMCLACCGPDTSLPVHVSTAQLSSPTPTRAIERTDPLDHESSPPPMLAGGLSETQSGLPLSSGLTAQTSQRGFSSSSKVSVQDATCALPSCRKRTKSKLPGGEGLRADFVLQKLTYLLRAHVPSITESEGDSGTTGEDDSARESAGLSTVDADAVANADRNRERERREGREEVSHTSSPDEMPKAEESTKRAMGRRKQWHSSKRNKARSKRAASSRVGSPALYKHSTVPALVTDVLSELECQVCVTLIYEPLTTPCGHTFCKRCLFRSLDHSSRCPLCRAELPGFNFFVTAPLNFTLSNLMLTTFPALYEEREEAVKQEQADTGLDTPIFVCMVAFPAMPTNLHIYEPRYRLMMRRAMDSNRRFGMVLPSRAHGGLSQYGTMLHIEDIKVFDDGRSLVQTVGVHRFKILESGTMDGYTVGRIERIDDIDDEEEAELERMALARGAEQGRQRPRSDSRASQRETPAPAPPMQQQSPPGSSNRSAPMTVGLSQQGSGGAAPDAPADYPDSATDNSESTNEQLMGVCKDFVEALRTGSTPWLIQRLNDSMPPMPDDPREFTWWMAMLMPIDDHEKARLLQITSYRLRLRLLVFWIQQMQHSWWFSRGCTIA